MTCEAWEAVLVRGEAPRSKVPSTSWAGLPTARVSGLAASTARAEFIATSCIELKPLKPLSHGSLEGSERGRRGDPSPRGGRGRRAEAWALGHGSERERKSEKVGTRDFGSPSSSSLLLQSSSAPGFREDHEAHDVGSRGLSRPGSSCDPRTEGLAVESCGARCSPQPPVTINPSAQGVFRRRARPELILE